MELTNYLKTVIDRKFGSKDKFLNGFKKYSEFILIDTSEFKEISLCARKTDKDCRLMGTINHNGNQQEFSLMLSEVYDV